MNKDERSIGTATVIALGFIVLGILNLFAVLSYHRTSIKTNSRIPGILFITVGLVIIIVKMIRRAKKM
jgi:hypothetical protein